MTRCGMKAQDPFLKIKSLEGPWQSVSAQGQPHQVHMQAAGSPPSIQHATACCLADLKKFSALLIAPLFPD